MRKLMSIWKSRYDGVKTFDHWLALPWIGEAVRKNYVQGRQILKSNRNIHA